MSATETMVFLLDVDNTLLDNDGMEADLKAHLERDFGAASRDRYWSIFEQLRSECGYADYLGALQRYRVAAPGGAMTDPGLLQMSSYLVDFPFATRLYPRALEVVAHLHRWGAAVILSDGDAVFQPRKVQRSGLWAAVEGRVLIYIHKELMLDDVQRRYPAAHYVMIDDKPRILAAVKQVLQRRVTTVFPRQGHYARAPDNLSTYPPADLSVEQIGDLLQYEFSPGHTGLRSQPMKEGV